MINSCKSTKAINSFEFTAIPSPRDFFRRYGARISDKGIYTASSDSHGTPQIVSSSSVIDQMINAENLLKKEVTK